MPNDLYFEILDGRNRAKQFRVQYGSIGSSPNAMTVLSEDGVHKFHCSICSDNSGFAIIDECKGGLKVNGDTVQKSSIKAGDVIEIGECRLRVRGAGTPTESPATVSLPILSDDDSVPPLPQHSTSQWYYESNA